jgi:hypothetical protein
MARSTRSTRRTTRVASEQPAESVQSSQSHSDQEPQIPPPAKSRRPARQTTTGPAATTARRRLRSAKEDGSPLQALQTPPKSLKQSKQPKQQAAPKAFTHVLRESDGEAHTEAQVESQPEEQVHTAEKKMRRWHREGASDQAQVRDEAQHERFMERLKPRKEGEGIDLGSGIYFQIRMRHELSFMTGLPQGPDFPLWIEELYRQVEIQYHVNEVEPLQSRVSEMQNRVAELERVQSRVAEMESFIEVLQARAAEMDALHARNAALEHELQRSYDFISLTAQVEIDPMLLDTDPVDNFDADADPTPQPPVNAEPSFVPRSEVLHGSERAIALLRKIENHKRSDQPETFQPEASPKSSEPVKHNIPLVETPKQQSFFGRVGKVLSAITSPFSSSRAKPSPSRTHQPDHTIPTASLTPAEPPSELTLSLTPTPTPVGERSVKSKTKQTKNHRHAVIKTIANSVRDSAEKDKAEAWAEEAFAKITKGSSNSGNKRKRLEAGIKVGDLKHISGCKPWTSGGYGMDDDIFDLSDSDDAPAWAVLQEMVLEQEESDQNPAKRLKSSHNVDMNDITSLNDTIISSPNESPSGIFNSGGKTASMEDVRPRSSRIGSPMFDIPATPGLPATHQQNQNVFKELDQQSPTQQSGAEKHAALQRELRRNGHVPGSGSFMVPEHSSDEDDSDDEDEADSTLWTQQPPPAPVPAHASLPTPVAETTSGPAVPLDPIDVQRAKITKHTPAKPSRLREVHVPSPSLRSDAGNESMMQSIIAAPPAHIMGQGTESMYGISVIPDAEPLDIPQEARQKIDNFISSTDGRAYLNKCSWDDPIAYFSDVDANFDDSSDIDADFEGN